MPPLLINKMKIYLLLIAFIFIAYVSLLLQTTNTVVKEFEIPEQSSIIPSYNVIRINNFPVKKGNLSSLYGIRKDPFTGKHRMHSGIDIAANMGEEVNPLGDGKVIFSGKKAGYGIAIEIQHGNTIVTRYAHLKRTLVKAGTSVSKDDVIAEVGNTGRSTGPHLHLEVAIKGKTVDPQIFLVESLASK